jgi:hypothetical protein
MRVRNFEKFSCRFGKRDIQAFLAEAGTLQEELEGDCGLPRTRVALDEIEVIAGQAPAQNVVEALYAGGQQFNRGGDPAVVRRSIGFDGQACVFDPALNGSDGRLSRFPWVHCRPSLAACICCPAEMPSSMDYEYCGVLQRPSDQLCTPAP